MRDRRFLGDTNQLSAARRDSSSLFLDWRDITRNALASTLIAVIVGASVAEGQSSQQYSDWLKWCQEQRHGHDIGGPNAPNCVVDGTGGSGSSATDSGGTPAIIALFENMQQSGIEKEKARFDAYNTLVRQADAQARAGNIDEFNRIIRQARPPSSELQRKLPIWVRDVNHRHYVGLAESAFSEKRYLDAAKYFRLALPFLTTKDSRESMQRNIASCEAADLWDRARNITSSAADQVAMYDRALRIDPQVAPPGGRAYVEWLRGQVAEERGNYKLAWTLYRDAVPLPGNDTKWNRDKLIALERRLYPPPQNETFKEQVSRELGEGVLISLLATTGDWDQKERVRLDDALHHLDLEVDRSGDNDQIAKVWGQLYREPPPDLVAEASRGRSPVLRAAGLQSGNDCAVYAIATASGRSYEDVASVVAAMVQRGSYRSDAERNAPMKTIQGQGLLGGEVVALAETLGAVEIVPPNRFADVLRAGRPVLIGVYVPDYASRDGYAEHQVVLSNSFKHHGETWFEFIDSNNTAPRYISSKNLDLVLAENGIAYRTEKRGARSPSIARQ